MVKNLLLLFIFFHIFNCNAQSDFYYLNDWHYKGNPKIVNISTFTVQTDSITGDELITQKNETQVDCYNKYKKCISHQWRNLETEITREFRFNYDSNGNRIEFIIFGKDSVLQERYLTILDSNQNEISHIVYNSKNELASQTFEIRTLGDLMETTITIDEAGDTLKKRVSILDTLGREIKSLNYYQNSEFPSVLLYGYNESDQILEYVRIRSYNDTIITKYTYDSLGREVESSQYNKMNNHCIYSYINIFRDSLNQREYHEYDNGQLTRSSYYYLDSNDCITKIIDHRMAYPSLFNRLKKMEHYETETRFQYDQRLNWVTKAEYSNGQRTNIQKRNFQYY